MTGAQPLELQAVRSLRRVQEAVSGIIEAVPGPTDRPSEIEKTLGLHKTLAWKLAKIVESSDPAEIFRRIPGAGAIEKVLEAASRLGVARERLEAVRSALAALAAFVEEHAGDRKTFEIMLAGFERESPAEIDLMYRKSAFRASSYVWGVEAGTIVRSVIVHPSSAEGMLDAAVIFGCVELRRLRADRPWVINRSRPTDDEGRPILVRRETIDSGTSGAVPLLSEFCSTHRPQLRRAVLEDGTVEDELLPGPIGNAGGLTCFTGEVMRDLMSRYHGEANAMMAQNLELRTPCRSVVFDHLVHRDLFGPVAPRLGVFGELAGRPLFSTLRSNRDRIDVFERVEHLGAGLEVLPIAEVPGYEGMVRHVCARLGWDPGCFDAYRLHMPFPFIPVTITYDYPLPEVPR